MTQQPDRDVLVGREGSACLPFLPWPMKSEGENLVPVEINLPQFTATRSADAQKQRTMEDPVVGLQVIRRSSCCYLLLGHVYTDVIVSTQTGSCNLFAACLPLVTSVNIVCTR